MRQIVLHVDGMICRHCVRTVSAWLSDVPGVVTIEADLVERTIRITGEAEEQALRTAVANAGYQASSDRL